MINGRELGTNLSDKDLDRANKLVESLISECNKLRDQGKIGLFIRSKALKKIQGYGKIVFEEDYNLTVCEEDGYGGSDFSEFEKRVHCTFAKLVVWHQLDN